ncbi:MAG TPA: M1 family metallopeptidase [Planctomycetota bacterium]|nr:M1 family metallopeptidase [Planctomycetota bacterium]
MSPEGEGVPDPFRQLGSELPTPGVYRTASGAPGHAYWQQQVDYTIEIRLDEDARHLYGNEAIVYHNQSPDTLDYLWVAIDPNIFAPTSHAVATSLAPDLDSPSVGSMQRMLARQTFDGSCKLEGVRLPDGTPLHTAQQDTMLRVDLPEPLAPGARFEFSIQWNYAINDSDKVGGRTGFEHFEEDDNCIFELAQWFPRLCAYTDYTGWQNKEFLGSGEFTLEFGNYDVHITVPDDHVVAATGVLQNPGEVLLPVWRERLAQAEKTGDLTLIVTPEEAKANESHKPEGQKTWHFQAQNVRDFAWASSRKFAWDALRHPIEGTEPVWAMSYFPNEGEPLWSRYSTRVVAHTLTEYSKHTFPYPYPVAISVNGPVGGMEYPMICFNGPRPEKDGTYSKRTKYGLITVIIHEVGHNWFPMIVNSDERQWTWMDEGLNTYCQFLAEQSWEKGYESSRGEARRMVRYMTSENQRPIMTGSEEILQFGNNAYGKPATALNVLRETVVGRELFDFAFQQYARRWKFKRPEPADLFRTLEDATAVDLDWFWRGWFFQTDACDQALTGVTRYRMGSKDPAVSKALAKAKREAEPESITMLRNAGLERMVDRYPELLDFYNDFDELNVTPEDLEAYDKFLNDKKLKDEDRAIYALDDNFYVVSIERVRDLVMPVILEAHFTDGTTQEFRWPAQVWKGSGRSIQKLIVTEREIDSLVLDPHQEIADADTKNNFWPPKVEEKTIELRGDSRRGGGGKNPMQAALEAEKKARDAESGKSGESDATGDVPPAGDEPR